MSMKWKAKFLGKAALMAAGLAALGGAVMLLWNAVVPQVFAGGRPVDYPQALGLLVLSRILFGGFRGHGGWRGHHHWRRWQAMTPDEREQFRRDMRQDMRHGPRAGAE